MPARRSLLLAAAAGLLPAAPRAVRAQAAQGASGTAVGTAEATGFITSLGNQLIAVINGPGSYEEKKRRLQPMVEAASDVDGIARFCLGRYIRDATPAQLAEYMRLFHDVLMNNIFGKIGEFQGVTFQTTSTTQRDAGVFVGTLIRRPNQQPNTVQWVVDRVGGQPKLVDIVAEGTSLRQTQRADYLSYLQRNNGNLEALLAALRQQVAR